MYNEDFIEFVGRCRREYRFGDRFIIGGGNPASRILFLGREPSGDARESNTLAHYEKNISLGVVDPWTRHREAEPGEVYWKRKGACWAVYQRLTDYIFPEDSKDRSEVFDFEERVFCSEMNGSPSPRTRRADTRSLDERKDVFFRDPFFDRFSVIVLACGNYIRNTEGNREIDDIFKVSYDQCFGNRESHFQYWTHYSADRRRLVVHTRNLSGDIDEEVLEELGKRIRAFLDSLK